MEYVVIETGGKQYRVAPGDVIDIDRVKTSKSPNEAVSFDRVLLHVADQDVKVGKPYLKNVVVSGKILAVFAGKKIRVARFTAKSRHRRVVGFRPALSRVQISKITKKV